VRVKVAGWPRRPRPQVPGGSRIITGRVRDGASLEPLPGVRVRLVLGGEDLAAPPATSNIEGEFRFDCRESEYDVLADKEGNIPAQVKVSTGPGQKTRIIIDLVRRSSEESAAGPARLVSAHQLSVPAKARQDFGEGLTLLNVKRDYAAAVSRFADAIHIYPSYYEAYAEMGVADYYGGDAPAAERAFRQSIELSSGKYVYAISNLAELLNNTKRFREAEPLAQQAISADDSSSRGYFELAHAQIGLKRPADAEPNAVKARDLEPDYPLAYIVLADIHVALHNYSAVLEDAEAYLKLVPDSPLSDQVRRTRQHVEAALQRTQTQSMAVTRPQ
jgi:Tfp pilus assembly protein PilF